MPKLYINIGVTGTRDGFTPEQETSFRKLLEDLKKEGHPLLYFHQGQCIGVDVQAAKYAFDFGMVVASHPPIKKDLIGECTVHIEYDPKGYFERNRNIVDNSDVLIVVPKTKEHQTFGGTWYTHDYAVKCKKPVIIISPDGSLL